MKSETPPLIPKIKVTPKDLTLTNNPIIIFLTSKFLLILNLMISLMHLLMTLVLLNLNTYSDKKNKNKKHFFFIQKLSFFSIHNLSFN
jgi:predicted membrane protein